MCLAVTLDKPEAGAELTVQQIRGIADDREAAATDGSVIGERRDEHDSALAHGGLHLAHIPFAITCAGEEMKHGAVVPYVDAV